MDKRLEDAISAAVTANGYRPVAIKWRVVDPHTVTILMITAALADRVEDAGKVRLGAFAPTVETAGE